MRGAKAFSVLPRRNLININLHTPRTPYGQGVEKSPKRFDMKFIPLLAVLLLANCAQDGRYPISGQECGPNDPVLTLDAADCTVPVPLL